MRLIRLALVGAVALFAHVGAAAAASAAPVTPTASIATLHGAKHRRPHRRGGHVRAAWPRPRHARAPRNTLARWLAKQVGPVHRRHRPRRRTAVVASAAATAGASSPLWLVRSFDVPATDPAYDRLANY